MLDGPVPDLPPADADAHADAHTDAAKDTDGSD